MDVLLGLTGFLGIVVGLLWSIVCLFRRRPFKVPAIVLVIAVLLFSAGLALSPAADERAANDEEVEALEDPVTKDPEPAPAEEEVTAEEEPAEPLEEEEVEPAFELEVHFIDVGQGDAIFIDAPAKDLLIDGGDRGYTVVNYLGDLGIDSLDLIIGTHPHTDHIGGLINVMETLPVGEIIDPGVLHTTDTYEDYINIIESKNITYTEGRAGMEWDLGEGITMQIIHPCSPSEDHLNNASIVTRVSYDQVSFMLTGDTETEAEKEILGRDYDLKSTILKAGHHGSSTSSTQAFLDALDPELAVIMCGEDNPYDHPHDETLERLAGAEIEIYRTDLQGDIIITTDGQTYEVNLEPWN